jgi:hypothetical protein
MLLKIQPNIPMVFPSPDSSAFHQGHPIVPDPSTDAGTQVRRVLVPVYMAVDIASEDPLQAECVAVDLLRHLSISVPAGPVQAIKIHSIIGAFCPVE